MTDTTNSTVPRRQLGRHLRELRNQAGYTIKGAAKALEMSDTKIWRVETGQTSLRSFDVEVMCRIYGAPPDLTEALMGLAKETKARGWWHSFGEVIPEGFNIYIGLEEAAARLDWYEPILVPGLLQTEDYARAIMRANRPDGTEEEIESRVDLRMRRQRLLTRVVSPPELRIVVDESVLRRPVGSPTLMAVQLRRMVELAELPTVALRVTHFGGGLHIGMLTGQFTILRFPVTEGGRETEPPTVYADGFTGSLYLDKPGEIARYDAAFGDLWRAALDEAASDRLILEVVGEYER
ncbi:XRE family transcriptional regulator [Streptomyces sp. 8K308]|uniref:helix-turn-helix domain-containing protein n=1 Tax=Streptomyces sp. 8K308 TaxID=2530388 RepID=UPI00104CA1B4|nr:helix-turn-helix transcriptional regulator [Streptomyces sp. 8K308]TDC20601.1 XRE family transcriptional regulator [Streptomyces sp. 8K308]